MKKNLKCSLHIKHLFLININLNNSLPKSIAEIVTSGVDKLASFIALYT